MTDYLNAEQQIALNAIKEDALQKSHDLAVKHTSKTFCGDQYPHCWEIKEGGECIPGIYPYIDSLTFCGINSIDELFPVSLIKGCLHGFDCI